MPVDLPLIKIWIEFLILVVASCSTGFSIWDRRNQVTQKVVDELREDVSSQVSALRSDIERRRQHVDETLESLKSRVADVPTREDIVRLQDVIHENSQISSELRGAVQAVQNTVQMINQHLLERSHG